VNPAIPPSLIEITGKYGKTCRIFFLEAIIPRSSHSPNHRFFAEKTVLFCGGVRIRSTFSEPISFEISFAS